MPLQAVINASTLRNCRKSCHLKVTSTEKTIACQIITPWRTINDFFTGGKNFVLLSSYLDFCAFHESANFKICCHHEPYCKLENTLFTLFILFFLNPIWYQGQTWWNISITYNKHFQLFFDLIGPNSKPLLSFQLVATIQQPIIMGFKIFIILKVCTIAIKIVKVCVQYFLFFHQIIALYKLWKMLFISSTKLFSFLRRSIFCNLFLPFHTFQYKKTNDSWIIYDVTNWIA